MCQAPLVGDLKLFKPIPKWRLPRWDYLTRRSTNRSADETPFFSRPATVRSIAKSSRRASRCCKSIDFQAVTLVDGRPCPRSGGGDGEFLQDRRGVVGRRGDAYADVSGADGREC